MANPQHADRGTPRPVAHRADTSTWAVDRAWLRVTAAGRTGAAWIAQPVTATRRAHLTVAAIYALVAVDAGLAVALLTAR